VRLNLAFAVVAAFGSVCFATSATAGGAPPWQVVWHGTWEGTGPIIDVRSLPQKQYLDSAWTFAVFGRAKTATRFAREQLKNLAGFSQPNLVQAIARVNFASDLLGVIIERQAGCGDLHISNIEASKGAVVATVYGDREPVGAACAQAVNAVIKLVTIDRQVLPKPPRAAGLIVGAAPAPSP
jgi:hypothetical protein